MNMRDLVVAAGVALGLSTLVSIAAGKMIAAGNRHAPKFTVIWRKTESVLASYTGRLTYLDDRHISVEGAEGPVVIRKADVVKVI